MLQININGVLSFLNSFSSHSPSPFPLTPEVLIAPYWTDLITTFTGNIWYQQSTDNTLLDRATVEIRGSFPAPETTSFTATNLLIVTWDQVPRYGNSNEVSYLWLVHNYI